MEIIKKKKSKATLNNIILVPTDFSEVCENAVRHTLQIAKYIDFKVLLLHVINQDTLNYLEKNNLSKSTLEDKLKEHAEKYKIEFGVEVTYLMKEGKLFKQVQKAVTETGSNMVVLGTHGKVGFQKITGSYALKVITKTFVPTIVVQKKALTQPYRDIVFPVTVESQDRQKVNWAIYIAKTFRSTVHIFPKRESETFHKKKIMSVVKQIKTIFDKHNVKYVDKVSDEGAGNFAKQVIDYAVSNNADLIMTMVSKGRFLPFFDSLDEQIIFNTSQIPVICINPTNVKKLSWH
ncbi:MAG: universal stress protein [Bacteroidales bacterium]|nr:universal stress protein [Bacteroidales bacterium]